MNAQIQLSLKQDLPLGIAAAGLGAVGLWIEGKKPIGLTEDQIANLNRMDINRFDRIATYNWRPASQHASDVLMILSAATPFLLYLDKDMRQNKQGLKLLALGAQSFAITIGLTNMTKRLAKRTRPYVYNSNVPMEERMERDARMSFFSGHTSVAAQGTFMFATFYSRTNRGSRLNPYIWAGAAALPLSTAFLRVRGGKHFPTDVIVGYVVGALTGYLIGRIHTPK